MSFGNIGSFNAQGRYDLNAHTDPYLSIQGKESLSSFVSSIYDLKSLKYQNHSTKLTHEFIGKICLLKSFITDEKRSLVDLSKSAVPLSAIHLAGIKDRIAEIDSIIDFISFLEKADKIEDISSIYGKTSEQINLGLEAIATASENSILVLGGKKTIFDVGFPPTDNNISRINSQNSGCNSSTSTSSQPDSDKFDIFDLSFFESSEEKNYNSNDVVEPIQMQSQEENYEMFSNESTDYEWIDASLDEFSSTEDDDKYGHKGSAEGSASSNLAFKSKIHSNSDLSFLTSEENDFYSQDDSISSIASKLPNIDRDAIPDQRNAVNLWFRVKKPNLFNLKSIYL